jgi:hypothetical protein
MKSSPTGGKSKPAADPVAGKRRASRIVHDERGNARIEWIEESAVRPVDRIPLAIVDEGARSTAAWSPTQYDKGFNPYQAGTGTPGSAEPQTSPRGKKDLRKLSEWIKQQRELEARKRGGEKE